MKLCDRDALYQPSFVHYKSCTLQSCNYRYCNFVCSSVYVVLLWEFLNLFLFYKLTSLISEGIKFPKIYFYPLLVLHWHSDIKRLLPTSEGRKIFFFSIAIMYTKNKKETIIQSTEPWQQYSVMSGET